jgi:hypothetical protein
MIDQGALHQFGPLFLCVMTRDRDRMLWQITQMRERESIGTLNP